MPPRPRRRTPPVTSRRPASRRPTRPIHSTRARQHQPQQHHRSRLHRRALPIGRLIRRIAPLGRPPNHWNRYAQPTGATARLATGQIPRPRSTPQRQSCRYFVTYFLLLQHNREIPAFPVRLRRRQRRLTVIRNGICIESEHPTPPYPPLANRAVDCTQQNQVPHPPDLQRNHSYPTDPRIFYAHRLSP